MVKYAACSHRGFKNQMPSYVWWASPTVQSRVDEAQMHHNDPILSYNMTSPKNSGNLSMYFCQMNWIGLAITHPMKILKPSSYKSIIAQLCRAAINCGIR